MASLSGSRAATPPRTGPAQSPMTLQTNEQVEAVPHNTTGLGGGTHSGARTGQASSANRLCSRGPVHHGHRGAGGLAAVVARPPTAGHMVLGVQSRGHMAPGRVTLPLPRNGEAVELTPAGWRGLARLLRLTDHWVVKTSGLSEQQAPPRPVGLNHVGWHTERT